jgi:hypothetical protein
VSALFLQVIAKKREDKRLFEVVSLADDGTTLKSGIIDSSASSVMESFRNFAMFYRIIERLWCTGWRFDK